METLFEQKQRPAISAEAKISAAEQASQFLRSDGFGELAYRVSKELARCEKQLRGLSRDNIDAGLDSASRIRAIEWVDTQIKNIIQDGKDQKI